MTLLLDSVSYRYAGAPSPSLVGLDLEVRPGEVIGVSGANESGKSTLALVASGLAPGTIGGELRGSVRIDGLDTAAARPHELAQRCGVLFQNPRTQLSGTAGTVFEEVAFGPRNLGLPVAGVVERVEGALHLLSIADLAPRDPERLSGGQAQLVALASVLAMQPTYLVLDEPTSQLDPLGTRLVGGALIALAARGGTGLLLVEHKSDLLERVCTRVVVLQEGRIALAGTARQVLVDPRLQELAVDPPAAVRLTRAVEAAGLSLDPDALAEVAAS